MPIQKTDAIILKTQKQGETSKIITLYTRSYGLEKMIAKGSRSTKSRYGGCLEPLNYLSVIFYRKESRELQFLSQADIIEPFHAIRNDVEKTAMALVICEIINRTQLAAEKNPLLFEWIIEVFKGIDNARFANLNHLLSFQLKFLDLSGYKPDLEFCLACRHQPADETIFFDYSRGGFFCQNCETHTLSGRSLSLNVLKYLRWLQRNTQAEIAKHKIPTKLINETSNWMSDYLNFHIEGIDNLKSLKIFKQIVENNVK